MTGRIRVGLNDGSFVPGGNAGTPMLECVVARFLAGRASDTNLTDEQADNVANWISAVWHVSPVSIPLFLEKFGGQISKDTARRMRAVSRAATVQGKAFRKAATEVARAFAERDIEIVALKGTASGFLAYDNPEHRTGADLDFCVRPDALSDAMDTLRSIGYWPGDYDPKARIFLPSDSAVRKEREEGHYALGFWLKMLDLGEVDAAAAEGFSVADKFLPFASRVEGLRVQTPVLVDIHHSIGAGISARDLMDRAMPVVWNDTEIFVPPRDWAAFHAMFKLYWEGARVYRKGFQYLADFARILTGMSEDDTDALLSLIEGHNFKPGGYYVLRRTPICTGYDLSDTVRSALAKWRDVPAGEDPNSYNDIGDFWPRLFGRL